jgi:hypothetical protein
MESPLPMEGGPTVGVNKPAAASGRSFNQAVLALTDRVLTVSLDEKQGNGSISVHNILGKSIAKAPLASGQARLALGETPAGRYFVSIQANGQKSVKEILLK